MAPRVTYRRRLSYNTRSNRTRVVKTPGGKLNLQYEKKAAKAPRCGDCGVTLPGVVGLRPREYAQVSKTKKHNRPRILIEEQKIVKKVLKSQTEKK
ncbi:unnamed protein product [Umbelopsis vinacea]